MIEETLMGVPVSQSASSTPMGESGIVARMTSGTRKELKVASRTKKTSSTATPSTVPNSRKEACCSL